MKCLTDHMKAEMADHASSNGVSLSMGGADGVGDVALSGAVVYTYEEGASPEVFFVPYIWTITVRLCRDIRFAVENMSYCNLMLDGNLHGNIAVAIYSRVCLLSVAVAPGPRKS